ncbi:hypothetical protein HETIRDRAFT_419223 [Heterobasidion irregulare TC 32-1]|uniref:Uncharacterized protein n=1 Tax=Heterobasidion irregulare (strain TC 32-1) TaxID=747525 RepID=W4K101_HETIT|nr:uncharacterized protein HETIRDRAFT_419223 [Heterobasidion irregulare TC 32-1]ETW79513.1 hypothetical protein HETIRDRAFT_419223 [Heterobasidion irregulare TC 32-1]
MLLQARGTKKRLLDRRLSFCAIRLKGTVRNSYARRRIHLDAGTQLGYRAQPLEAIQGEWT